MDSHNSTVCHVAAVPFPGRGHVNPMMNLCKLLASKSKEILISFVVTEEWLGFIGSDPKPNNIRFASIPNVIPSELVRGANYPEFYEAVMTKLEAPFELLLDRLEPPVTAVLADFELLWVIPVGISRNIPVASLCTTSATFFSMLRRFDQVKNRQLLINILEHGDKLRDNFEGVSSTDVDDLRMAFHRSGKRVMELALDCLSWVPKAQYLLFTSPYELEPQVYDTLKQQFPFPIYHIGPAIPYFETNPYTPNYIQWLDSQPQNSVLYVSLGSFLSVSSTQMDEIAYGLENSGVRYLWVARGNSSRVGMSRGKMGLVVEWCDQLRVLCHDSVGGFWTHCGWNSTLEGAYSGVPMLTFPIFYDQVNNSEKIVEEWGIGWRMRENEDIVVGDEIANLVGRFMDKENFEVQKMRKRAREMREMCHQAVAEGGSSVKNINAFMNDIMNGMN